MQTRAAGVWMMGVTVVGQVWLAVGLLVPLGATTGAEGIVTHCCGRHEKRTACKGVKTERFTIRPLPGEERSWPKLTPRFARGDVLTGSWGYFAASFLLAAPIMTMAVGNKGKKGCL